MRRTVAWIAAGVLLVGVWTAYVDREYRAVKPRGATLQAVVTQVPDFLAGCVFTGHGGTEYLAVYGPSLPTLCFASCGPMYIFDHTGTLLDWTSDFGDDPRFNNRWPGAFRGRPISRDEVMRRAEVK